MKETRLTDALKGVNVRYNHNEEEGRHSSHTAASARLITPASSISCLARTVRQPGCTQPRTRHACSAIIAVHARLPPSQAVKT